MMMLSRLEIRKFIAEAAALCLASAVCVISAGAAENEHAIWPGNEFRSETELGAETEPETLSEMERPAAVEMERSATDDLARDLEVAGIEPDERITELRETVNPDICAVINIGGSMERIVLEPKDNDFYLHHDETGAENPSGAVFVDARFSYYPADRQILIHGHNMKDGSSFGLLNLFRDVEYLKKHPLITWETLAGVDTYVPYALLDINADPEADDFFQTIQWDFTDEEFQEYIDYQIEHSYFQIPVDVDTNDTIMVLSTCSYGYSDGRFQICARKLREGESAEKAAELVGQAAEKSQ